MRTVGDVARKRAGAEAGERIAAAFAKSLHRLMAYKDEYEVARLHLDPVEKVRREADFGADASVTVLLHPPVLRALGMKRKIRMRRTAGPAFRLLRAAKVLRGTRLDVFGYARVRRVERELIVEYQQLMTTALDHLTPETANSIAEIAALPELIRGYEDIKLARVEDFRAKAESALARLQKASAGQPS